MDLDKLWASGQSFHLINDVPFEYYIHTYCNHIHQDTYKINTGANVLVGLDYIDLYIIHLLRLPISQAFDLLKSRLSINSHFVQKQKKYILYGCDTLSKDEMNHLIYIIHHHRRTMDSQFILISTTFIQLFHTRLCFPYLKLSKSAGNAIHYNINKDLIPLLK